MGCGATKGGKYAASKTSDMPEVRTSYGEVLALKTRIQDNYQMDKNLGEGGFGKVSLATVKGTKSQRAVKFLPKSATKMEEFSKEIRICAKLDHPQIVKLYEIYEDSNTFYMVMEVCLGGELFDVIVALSTFSERQASVVMEQATRGVFYMHQNGVCHRDLKPENFLLEERTEKVALEKSVIKIVDFGIAKEFQRGVPMTEAVGTPFYVSPQVLYNSYSELADVWSLGVLMYILLCGFPPFNASGQDAILKKVKSGRYEFPSPEWDGVSEKAKSLIQRMLTYEESKRWTASQCLEDVWIKREDVGDHPLQSKHLENLREFSGGNKLKKAAKLAIARRMNEQDLKDLKSVFTTLDVDKNGVLTFEEVKAGVDQVAVGSKKDAVAELAEIMSKSDVNGNMSLDYTEFVAATLDKRMFEEERVLWQAFKSFDKDGSGKISRTELAKVIDTPEVKEVFNDSIENIMKDVDKDNDGEIDFKEFMQMMKA